MTLNKHPLFDLAGRVALVTGGASGLGRAMVDVLAENGAHVVIGDIQKENGAKAVAELAARGLSAEYAYLDVSQQGGPSGLIRDITGTHGKLDTVFANAGVSAGPGPFTDIGKISAVTPERWQKVLDANLTGVFETIQAATVPMLKQRYGRIIVTCSIAGIRGDRYIGYAYVATKAAVTNLVRQTAMEMAPHGITVNGIAPGPFRTNIGDGRMHDPETDKKFAQTLPIGRVGNPQEIKGLALLLASESCSFMTGATVPIDGGALTW